MFKNLWNSLGFNSGSFASTWPNYVMLLISFVLMYLAIVKKFEPLLLLPIAFGMFLINLPGAYNVVWGTYPDASTVTLEEFQEMSIVLPEGWQFIDGQLWTIQSGELQLVTQEMFNVELQAGGIQLPVGVWFSDGTLLRQVAHTYENVQNKGLLWYLFYGVQNVIYPPLIFLGIGAMTDFGPLISNPKSMIIGAAAQLGVFLTLIAASLIGFNVAAAASIAIIGGADGPTAIYVTQKMSAWSMFNGKSIDLLSAIAVAAYSYMALIPIIQKPIMRLLVPKKERQIKMKPLRTVSKVEKIIFPILVTLVVGILLPDAVPLLGMLMLGNLLKECGVCDRLSSQAQNGLMNTVTIFLGVSVGCKAYGGTFLQLSTLGIIGLGLVAFACGTIGGLLVARLMCKLSGGKINPLIGSAGVSAVPMAARISEDVGRESDPSNHLLMHAMGPNVAGVIGSAIAAGFLLAII
ncbi:MAG: sodium ion-translocating decarboxylase subunit beta [Clostridiales bacterium]|nr:sodium ion-translocating decarboxylase subunit beta [Clostridiales bacterium]